MRSKALKFDNKFAKEMFFMTRNDSNFAQNLVLIHFIPTVSSSNLLPYSESEQSLCVLYISSQQAQSRLSASRTWTGSVI